MKSLTIGLVLVLVILEVIFGGCSTQKTEQIPSYIQEKYDAPIWNVGDYWKFQREDKRWWEYKVERSEDDIYVIKNPFSGEWEGYDKKNLKLKYYIDSVGNKRQLREPAIYYFDFPIYVGKKWSKTETLENIDGIDLNYLIDFAIKSYEDVTVTAGTFKAFKIEQRIISLQHMSGGKAYIWFSPEVKNVVKVTHEKISFWNKFKDYELTTYKLPAPKKLIEYYRTRATQQMKLISPPAGVDIFPIPQLVVGDTWVKQTDIGKFIYEVEKVDDSGMTLRQGEKKYYYDKEYSHFKTEIEGEITHEFIPPYKGWHFFPIWIGKKWENNYMEKNLKKGTIYNFRELVEVKNLEKIQTPAGNFNALKIDISINNLDTGGHWSYTVWYSPELKANIKSVWKELPNRNWILSEFKLKQFGFLPRTVLPEELQK